MQSSENKSVVYKGSALFLLLFLLLGCRIVISTPLPTEIPAASIATPVAIAGSVQQAATGEPGANASAGAAPEPGATPTPVLNPTPTPVFLERFSTEIDPSDTFRASRALPRHGIIIAVVIPLIVFGIPWLIFELFTIRYVQPQSFDLSTVRIKAQDGLFIQATLSVTARKTMSMASTRMTWPRVINLVEKTVEQELIHEALSFPTLEELEQNIKFITEKFLELPVLRELYRDFGVEVMRFNIESYYPQETMDALNRKAEASAGGAAYLAYAAAAHLNPDSQESRDLYRVYQQTTSRVDAARNLGGGIASAASVFRREEKKNNDKEQK